MEYDLLKKIDEFVKEKGISTTETYISTRRLPRFLVEAAIRELSKNGTEYRIDDTCVIAYDKNGYISLILTFNNGKTSLLITDTTENLSFENPNFKFTKIRSQNLFKKARRIEWVERRVHASFNQLYGKYIKKYETSITETDNEKEAEKRKVRLVKKKNEFKNVLRDQIEFLLESGEVEPDFEKESSLTQELQRFENAAKQYIEYINNEYIESKKTKDKSNIVYFEPEEPEGLSRRSGEASGSLYVGEQERKNVVLASNFRDDVITELEPIMTKIAIPNVITGTYVSSYVSEEDQIDKMYTCSLIALGNNEYKLIMEPFNGMKYTRVAYFTYDGEMTDEVFTAIIKKYISLNQYHVLSSPSMIQISHTSRDAYMNAIWYSVLKDKKLSCHKYFMDKVDSMTPEVIEKVPTL
jgi:hypothetical protein